MKYAIISDIHANLEALTAVMVDIELRGAQHIICLGDLVGYHAEPNECVAAVRQAGARCIAGNHDRAAAGLKQPVHFGSIGRKAILWTRRRLQPEHSQFLQSLPLTRLVDDSFMIVHGALHPNPNEDLHLSTPERVDRSMRSLITGQFGTRLCFYGHTHRAAVHEYRAGALLQHSPDRIPLSAGSHYLINPGSVGQPRDGTNSASYAMFDSRSDEIRFHRVQFDWEACRRKAQAAGLLEPPSTLQSSLFWATDRLDSALKLLVRGSNRLARAAVAASR